jgi:hypothetical protein
LRLHSARSSRQSGSGRKGQALRLKVGQRPENHTGFRALLLFANCKIITLVLYLPHRAENKKMYRRQSKIGAASRKISVSPATGGEDSVTLKGKQRWPGLHVVSTQ